MYRPARIDPCPYRSSLKIYDLYLLARDRGVILGWHSFEAEDDQAAIEIASRLVTQPPVELWLEGNRVKRWDQLP